MRSVDIGPDRRDKRERVSERGRRRERKREKDIGEKVVRGSRVTLLVGKHLLALLSCMASRILRSRVLTSN